MHPDWNCYTTNYTYLISYTYYWNRQLSSCLSPIGTDGRKKWTVSISQFVISEISPRGKKINFEQERKITSSIFPRKNIWAIRKTKLASTLPPSGSFHTSSKQWLAQYFPDFSHSHGRSHDDLIYEKWEQRRTKITGLWRREINIIEPLITFPHNPSLGHTFSFVP